MFGVLFVKLFVNATTYGLLSVLPVVALNVPLFPSVVTVLVPPFSWYSTVTVSPFTASVLVSFTKYVLVVSTLILFLSEYVLPFCTKFAVVNAIEVTFVSVAGDTEVSTS